MGLGSMMGKLFGGGGGHTAEQSGAATAGEAVEYNGFTITPAPIKEGGQYRTAGTIAAEVDGDRKEVRFIRADNSADLQSAQEHSVRKGKQIVDEQGASVLEREQV